MEYPYDERKEDVKKDVLFWLERRKNEERVRVSMDQFELGVYHYVMEGLEGPEEKPSIGEKICAHVFLFRTYMETHLYSEEVLIGMNELFKNKEEIQQDLGEEDYARLLEEIDFIMDKYWRRVEAMSLHELMALYRRKER